MASDPQAFRAVREGTLFRLLLRGYRAESGEVIARLHERGHRAMKLSYPRLLANLDTEGTTISGLAAKAGISRQAAGQQLKEIEERGFVEFAPHPKDGRATIVRFTPKGLKMHRDAVDIVLELEAEYGRLLGKRRLKALLHDLGELVDHIDPVGRLGRE